MNRYVINDRILLNSLKKIQQLKPKVIGLDIVRDIPIGSDHENLLKVLKNSNPTIISPCASPDPDAPKTASLGYRPPTGIETEQQGSINLFPDRDQVIRRYVLASDPPETGKGQCNTSQSLSLRLASRYLGMIDANETPEEDIQLKEFIIPVLREAGVYQSKWSREKIGRGYQVLIHYRSRQQSPARQISLTDVLENKVDPKIVEGRVVLIGYVAKSAGDDFDTPINRNQEQKLPGVLIHAHMTSQLLSSVFEHRPLLRSPSALADSIWIGLWAICGTIIAALNGKKRWGLFIVFFVGVIGFPYALISLAWWVPVIPAVFTFLFGFTGQLVYNFRHRITLYRKLQRSSLLPLFSGSVK